MSNGMRIGKIARSVGLTTESIRYYERSGRIEKGLRTESGYRVYSLSKLTDARIMLVVHSVGIAALWDERVKLWLAR